jgi:hypothetical protein
MGQTSRHSPHTHHWRKQASTSASRLAAPTARHQVDVVIARAPCEVDARAAGHLIRRHGLHGHVILPRDVRVHCRRGKDRDIRGITCGAGGMKFGRGRYATPAGIVPAPCLACATPPTARCCTSPGALSVDTCLACLAGLGAGCGVGCLGGCCNAEPHTPLHSAQVLAGFPGFLSRLFAFWAVLLHMRRCHAAAAGER